MFKPAPLRTWIVFGLYISNIFQSKFKCTSKDNPSQWAQDVLRTSLRGPFRTKGRPIRTAWGRPEDVKNETLLVRPILVRSGRPRDVKRTWKGRVSDSILPWRRPTDVFQTWYGRPDFLFWALGLRTIDVKRTWKGRVSDSILTWRRPTDVFQT